MTITQGDEITITLTCSGQNLSGAVLSTIFPKGDGTDLVVADSAHTIDGDQTANKGKFTLDLTAAQTALIKDGENQNIITKVEQAGDVIHFHGVAVLNVKKSTFRSS